jgi:hypothetical protein
MGASPVHSQRRLIVAPAEPAAADKTCIALSFNGRTSDSDSLDRGSNPWGATKRIKIFRINKIKFQNRDSNRTFSHPKPCKISRFCEFLYKQID